MKIYLFDITKLEMNDIEENAHLLSGDRQEKIKSKRMDNDKKLSYAAGIALKNALLEYDIDEKKAEYTYTGHGKPYIQNKEKKVYFNLSHSGKCAVAIVCETEVGIDIERIRCCRESVVKRCFSEAEKKVYSDSSEKDKTFFAIWTLKESFLKATGDGITLDMAKVETDYNGADSNVEVFYKKETTKAFARVIEKIEGYMISICSFKPIGKIEMVYVNNNNISGKQRNA